jgi:hypothetical protein
MAASVQPKFGWEGLRISFTCAEAILAGQLVERRTGSRLVGVAGAASTKVAGVAQWDVPAARASIQGPQVADGHELTVVRWCVVKVTFVAAAAVGDKLIAAAAGQVDVAGATPDARTVVGEAFEAVGAGAVGLAVIY